ncbi:MAG: HAMP domain-containing histidine kinase [Myxococcales bacterium]|nr:HAMP domain-containing histidine kinase [Myxococcales bacterium]
MSERGLLSPERAWGHRLLYFALIPAVVIAVLVLGGFALRSTLQADRARTQAVVNLTATLAAERAGVLDNLIIAQDNVVAAHASLSDLSLLGRRWLQTASRETPSVRAILVIDMTSRDREVVAFASRSPSRDDDVFRRLLLGRLLQQLDLDAPLDELRHLHEVVEERQFLLSYWRRAYEGRRYVIVAWHDVDRLVREVMPQLYRDPDRGDARMNVVDERGRIVYGPPLKVGRVTVGLPFPTTLYNWRLQVALTSAEEVGRQAERQRTIELALVIVAGIVTIASLFIVMRGSVEERRLSALKSDFVANVSHELKTPLSLIRMFGELLLLDRASSAEKKKQYLQIIVSESERLTALIENVLDFARVERGKATYDFAVGSVAEVARRAVEIYQQRAVRDEVQLSLEIVGPPAFGSIDAKALELAVMNLIDNALKYAKAGGQVIVRVDSDEARVRLRVIDFGPGVPKEEQSRIFERFYRGKSAEASCARGSGIGLSLVRHIVESHGGRVRVESPLEEATVAKGDGAGIGTAFEVSIPRVSDVEVPAALPEEAPPPSRRPESRVDQLAEGEAKGES